MKRIIGMALLLVLTAGGLAFAQAKDGVYFAQDGGFDPKSGWKEQVVVTVSGGRITQVEWNGVSNLGVADKKTVAAAGAYGMKKASKIGAEWDQQAAAVEAYLVKTQNVKFSKFKSNGSTDAISGATMNVKGFFDLVNKALASAPVPKGIYKRDGWYFAQQPAFDKQSGWKDSVLLTVVNGTLVDALWNGTYKDKSKKSKLVESQSGRYGMAKAAKKGEWHQQTAAVEQALLKTQDPARIALKKDGTSDAVSGATIHLTALPLAVEALKGAR